MSLESSVRECGASLGSTRATDRKKNGEILKNFLSRDAVPDLLSENSRQCTGYTWDCVYDDINELVMKETEKYELSKTFETVSGPLCANLLHLCVSGSIKGQAYVRCDKVVDSCLLILRDKRLRKAIGDAYLNLLYKYVLTCDHYLMNITPIAWEELLEVCLSICNSKHSKLDEFTKLRLVLLIMKNAKNNCQFVIPLRDTLPKLTQIFTALASDKKVQEVVIDINIVLIETLSAECRSTMCEFTEGLMPTILKFYDQNVDQKKKGSLFKLLNLIVKLHHPLGRTQQEKGSHANSWELWNKSLHSISEVICVEVTYLQKQRKPMERKNYKMFSEMAASVYYQIFNTTVKRDQEVGETCTKKVRLSYNRNSCFYDLVEEMKQNSLPWLSVIHDYLKNYGHSVSARDYKHLLETVETLITHTSNQDWDLLGDLACLIVKNLSTCTSKNEEDDALLSLWNACVRTSSVVNMAHKPTHSVMQLLLKLDIMKYINVQPLVKLYFEQAMPVTDYSLMTLNSLFQKFYSKFNNVEDRLKCFSWLIHNSITCIKVTYITEFLLRLLVTENVVTYHDENRNCRESLHNILFSSIEKEILFNEFEIDHPENKSVVEEKVHNFELNLEVHKKVNEYILTALADHFSNLNSNNCTLLEFIKFTNISISYLDIMLKHDLLGRDKIERGSMYSLMKAGLQGMYSVTTEILKKDVDIRRQIKSLQALKEVLMSDYDRLLSTEIRRVPSEFFKELNRIVNKKISNDDAEIYQDDDTIMDPQGLRHICVCLLAAYCRKLAPGRAEILDFILDSKIYDFSTSWDVNCALESLEILYSTEVEEMPLDLIFFLMQGMCKELFKNSEATFKMLIVFLKLFDKIHNLENGKQNCYIMVRGYLQRCEKKFYPPHVAALIYESAIKMVISNLNQCEDVDNMLLETVRNKVKGDVHSIRVYCCYLLKLVVGYMSDHDIVQFLEDLMDIFIVRAADTRESILKDELMNRTVTVLHSVLALVQAKNSLLHDIISRVIHIQKEKSLDKNIVKKVLDKITKLIENKSAEEYFNDNVVFILNSWYSYGYIINNMPFFLFGMNNTGNFIEKHFKWAIPADILWRHRGSIKDSAVFKYVLSNSNKSAEEIVEACLCNIIALSIPYYVRQKFNLNNTPPGKQEWSQFGIRMFEASREIIGTEKWSTLFADNISEVVILVAMNFNDCDAAMQEYDVNLPVQKKSYQYPMAVFDAILKQMGELIEEDILNYLCANQALTIFKALFQLWTNVIDENVFEYKVLYLNSYVMFIETVPFDHPSDAFICNYACQSLAHAIQQTKNKKELRVLTRALKKVLQKILPAKVDFVRKAVSQILTILMNKKDEGFEPECATLLQFLVCDMKDCLNANEDVIDFISSLSQGAVANLHCSTKTNFLERLTTHRKSLSCLSHETLTNMRDFLKNNKLYVNSLCEELNKKGFSDDCGTSILHQIIHALSNILKSATDNKTIIEACNCLSQIGNYDLKTLVTVPPTNIERITDLQPKLYFSIVVMTALTEILFDESPLVTNAISKTLKRLMQYRDGEIALEFASVNKDLLLPLASTNCAIAADFKIIDGRFRALCAKDFWVSKTEETHEQWLIRITCAILEVLASPANYLSALQAVCTSKPNICHKILAPLLGLLLGCSSEAHIKVLSNRIDHFFTYMYNQNCESRMENSEDSERRQINVGQDQKIIIQYMLDVVNFVRLQRGHYSARQDRAVESLNYLRIDYAKVAGVATVADQNVAAIYYGELWAVAQNGGVPLSSPDAMSQLQGGDNVQRIFRKCFVSIGEMDAIDGCGTAHLTSEEEKRKHLINTSQFADALLLHDIALSCGGQIDLNLQYGVVKSLHKSGMHHLALQYIKSLPEEDDLNDIKYECLSFLGDWSDFVDTRELEAKSKETNIKPYSVIKAFRYSILKDCLNLQSNSDLDTKLVLPLNRAKKAVAKLCQNLNMENCQNVYKVLSKLHLFNDIEDYFAVRSEKLTISSLLQNWQVKNLPSFNDFKHLEPLISQRSLVLEYAAKEFQASLKDIVPLQLQYAELGLANERVQMAQRILAVVKKVSSSPEVTFTESQLTWSKGHKDIALSLLRNTISSPSLDARLTAVSLRQYGIWMAESKRDNARDIINKYLQKSLQYLNNTDHEDTRLKVYYDIAKFADAEYKQIVAYMSSSIYEKKVQCVETLKGTANSLRQTQPTMNRDERKAFAASDKFGQMDEAEIENTKQEKNTFLQLAMRYYLLSLRQSEVNNLSVFRVISLWLDNPSIQLSDAEGDFEELLHGIPSRKFVTALPQLAPRLTNEKSPFADNLKRLLKRCALEHPHHTLPILFSLKNSYKDKMILNASENIGGPSQRVRGQEPRVTAAYALVNQLAKEDGELAKIVQNMDMMCDAIISLANFVPKTKEVRQKIPSAERIPRLGPLDAVPVPTVTLPLSLHGKYNHIPSIVAFDNCFELVGGINCPKKIYCRSSDGKKWILLIKGEDDLRQDAMMQQVFNIVNTLLEKDSITSRSKLLIRTYKVVPMSKKSGVLEWCEGTMPIGSWLVGPSGAHARYRPQDLSANAARNKMQAYFEQRKSAPEKLANFQKILKEFRPVFHYFFTEHFLDPVTWYERRLAYTKSVASSSMVGYILGLGDRHLQNILIDKRTAEVVHIDFGIAFDQGKTLPTPETIPFRLTQDIIAGFGSSGVEGIFRRSCEKSMQLLRDNQETLLTILEVLLHDPLYTWSVISKQQNVSEQSRDTSIMQSSGSGSLAKRALLTVSSKLSGTEGGAAGGVAVAGQVARLVRYAQDPANLSRLYPGWQPYL